MRQILGRISWVNIIITIIIIIIIIMAYTSQLRSRSVAFKNNFIHKQTVAQIGDERPFSLMTLASDPQPGIGQATLMGGKHATKLEHPQSNTMYCNMSKLLDFYSTILRGSRQTGLFPYTVPFKYMYEVHKILTCDLLEQ